MALKRNSPMVGVYLFLVFLSGSLVGAFGHRLYSAKTVNAAKPPAGAEAWRKKYLKEMETRLKMDQDQLNKLVVILDETKARFKVARERLDPEMKQIQTEQRMKVKEILKPDQQEEYQRMVEEREKRAKEREANGGGC